MKRLWKMGRSCASFIIDEKQGTYTFCITQGPKSVILPSLKKNFFRFGEIWGMHSQTRTSLT